MLISLGWKELVFLHVLRRKARTSFRIRNIFTDALSTKAYTYIVHISGRNYVIKAHCLSRLVTLCLT